MVLVRIMASRKAASSTLPVGGNLPDPFKTHEAGSLRHGAAWLQANRRAVEVLWGCRRFRVDDAEVKRAVPLMLLRVLDGQRTDAGETWNPETKQWENPQRAETPVQHETNQTGEHETER